MKIETKTLDQHFKDYLGMNTSYKGGKAAKNLSADSKLYKLSSNENPIGTSPKVLAVIKKHTENLHLYPDNTDIRLRVALAKEFNFELDQDQFITANSGLEIIDLLVRAFVREGEEVIVSNPCFLPYTMFSRWGGAKVVDVPLLGASYQLDVAGILQAITDQTRIIFLTSPNNPTGTYIPDKVLAYFLDQIPSDILVVYDEVYRHFVQADDYTTALPFVKLNRNIVAVNSFSKTYGLAGMRIGYCYTTLEIANYVRQICRPFLIPTLSLEAGIAALEDRDFVEDTVQLIKKERAFLTAAFKELKLDFTPTQTNFFLIDPPIPDKQFVEHMQVHGVMVRPVANFGAPGKVRISIGTRDTNETMLAALRTVYR